MKYNWSSLISGVSAWLLLGSASASAQTFPALHCTSGSGESCKISDGVNPIRDNPLQNLGLGTPIGAELGPSAQHLYVANSFGDTYSILALNTPFFLDPVADVNLTADCFPVDLTVAGDKLYAACFGPDLLGTRTAEGHIEVFRKNVLGLFQTPSSPARVDLDPDPFAIDMDPFTAITDVLASKDGRHVYVSYIQEQSCGFFRFQFGSIAIIRTDTDQVTDTFPDVGLCSRPDSLAMLEPLALALSPDGRKLYVSLHKSSPAHVAEVQISAAGDAFVGSGYTAIPLCSTPTCSAPSDEDSKDPTGLLVSANGSKLYVTHNGLTGTPRFRISVVNTATRTVSKRIDLPGGASPGFIDYNPTAPAFTRDGTKVLVPLFGDDNNPGDHIAVIDAATDTLDLAATIKVPLSAQFDGGLEQLAKPVNVIFHPTEPYAYSINNLPDTVTVLRTEPPPVPELGLAGLLACLGLTGLFLRRQASGARTT